MIRIQGINLRSISKTLSSSSSLLLPKWPTRDFSHEDKTTTLGDDRARYPLSLLCDRIFGQVRKQGKYPHKPMTWCSISNKKNRQEFKSQKNVMAGVSIIFKIRVFYKARFEGLEFS